MLKFRSSHPLSSTAREDTSEEAKDGMSAPDALPVSLPAAQAARSSSPPRQANQPPTLTATSRATPRDVHSSIAGNLASARGIPSGQRRRGAPASPALSVDQAGGKILASLDQKRASETARSGKRRDRVDGTGRVSLDRTDRPSTVAIKNAQLTEVDLERGANVGINKIEPSPTPPVEPFQRFYATFENLISKLSAPLAFAGLPLVGEPPATAVAENPSVAESHGEQERAPTEPDLSKIFSKAALQAIKDSNGQNILGAGGESFYVVPTTGGTISYAGILSRAEQERRARLHGRVEDEDEDEPEFVDAREMPPTPSLEKSRHGPGRTWKFGPQTPATTTIGSTKTLEELRLENQALKQLSDTLSRRLHMWEVNAQSSSMALQQSLRALHRSPAASVAGRLQGGDEASEKAKELEEQLRKTTRELERLGRENAKLKATVGNYREKWEKLKVGAKTRREASKVEGATADGWGGS